ncbi:RICIN domain-containing protein, partial [Candidatus Saccharibacteria bacterium]|nr:RICIN domain-containing protein [Candidatus Saccharibacteria bacterium]
IENDDETYSFYSSCSGLALDLSGGIANSGANINIWRVNGSGAQRWRLKHYNSLDNTSLIEAKYSIASNLDINERIDINGGVEYADIGTNIQLWHNNETAAQQWFLRKNNDGTYTFVNTDTGKVIDAKGGSGEKGANIQLWNDNGTCAQKWFIEEKSGGYVFRSSCSGLVIDASGGIANDGVNINLWNENGTEAQVWNLMKIQ